MDRTATDLFRAIFALLLALGLSACAAWPERPDVTAQDQATARVAGFGSIRLWQDESAPVWNAWREAYLADRAASGRDGDLEMLSISSGSDKGAFSAGFLNGWSETGKRPQFDIVSGVSTGALIAPFAFLGADYDPRLKDLYTTINAKRIYRATALKGLFGGASLADTRPLAELIEQYADEELIDAVAREHTGGRRLLVQTTNLDAERGVVWDMGAIANSQNPERYAIFRRVLLASASIPGLFPPVLIDVESEAMTFSELHVDGGTTSGIFAVPPSVLTDGRRAADETPGRITVLYNGALRPVFRVSQPTVFSLLERALTTSLKTADQRSIDTLRVFAEENQLTLDVHSVGPEAEDPDVELFDQGYMNKLYALGRQRALETYP